MLHVNQILCIPLADANAKVMVLHVLRHSIIPEKAHGCMSILAYLLGIGFGVRGGARGGVRGGVMCAVECESFMGAG